MCVNAPPSQSADDISITIDRIVMVDLLNFSCGEFPSNAKVDEADTRGIGKMEENMSWINITMNNAMRVKVVQGG